MKVFTSESAQGFNDSSTLILTLPETSSSGFWPLGPVSLQEEKEMINEKMINELKSRDLNNLILLIAIL